MPNEIESYTPFYKGKVLIGLGGGGGGSSTDENVLQTPTDSANSDYEVLLSSTADNLEHTEGARKTQHIKFNPFSKLLKLTGHLYDKWGLQTSRSLYQSEFDELTQEEKDNGTTYYVKDGVPLRICDYIYPIGAIYMSVNNISPAILFGGTWERIKDRFLLAAGDDYNAGSTGGEVEHTLIEAELPTISGSWQIHAQENGTIFYIANGYATGTLKSGQYKTQTTATSGAYSQQSPGFKFGQDQPHNNMPPYLTVNVWVRVPDPVQQEEEEGE